VLGKDIWDREIFDKFIQAKREIIKNCWFINTVNEKMSFEIHMK
jgi:hypothetical protein